MYLGQWEENNLKFIDAARSYKPFVKREQAENVVLISYKYKTLRPNID